MAEVAIVGTSTAYDPPVVELECCSYRAVWVGWGCRGWDEVWWFDMFWPFDLEGGFTNYFVEFMLIHSLCCWFGWNIWPTFANLWSGGRLQLGYSQDSQVYHLNMIMKFHEPFFGYIRVFQNKTNTYTDMLTAIRVSKYISQYMDPFETSATHLQTIPWMKLHLPSLGYQHLLVTLRPRWFFGPKIEFHNLRVKHLSSQRSNATWPMEVLRI